MTDPVLTKHAADRMQQRSVPPIVIEWLDEFGDEQFDGHGGIVNYFSRRSRRRLERQFGRRFVRENSKYLDRYMVRSAADGALITIGVLTASVRRR